MFRPSLPTLPHQSIQAQLLVRHRVNRQVCPLRLLLAKLRALSPAAVQANPQLSRRVMVLRHPLLFFRQASQVLLLQAGLLMLHPPGPVLGLL